jgi:LysR family glycine cleavage system transcriptional activator
MPRPDAPSWERWFARAAEIDPEAATITAPKTLQFNEEIHAIEAAIAGLGVTLVSDIEVALDIAAGLLVAPIDFGLKGLTFRAVHLKSSRRAPEIKCFADWAVAKAHAA